MKDHIAEDFKKTGTGYGKQIAYISLAVQALTVGSKDVTKAKNLIDAVAYENFKNNLIAQGQEMEGKNGRIYFDSIPDPASLPKIEKKMMVSPAIIPDDLNSQAMQKRLEELVPKGAKEMILNYKKQMMEYISQNLNNYENDSTVMQFLTDLNLPYALETVLSQNEISESLWKRINDVQQKGGTLYLTNNISNLEKKSEEVARRINDILFVIKSEEEEDNKYRNLYGNRWIRTPSSNLNFQYVGIQNDYSKKLEVARKCDSNTKAQIMENMKYYEYLGMSKDALKNKIPVKVDASSVKDCQEAKSLRADLDNLDNIKEKLMEVINKIFQSLNEDNVIPQFIQVLQGKTTEKNVFNENKSKYDEIFKELEFVSNEVKEMKKSIIAKNEAFTKVKTASFKTPPENEKFLKDLEEYVQGYNQRLVNLNQGMNFYNEFNTRLDEVNIHVTDFLMARDLEKNENIKSINSGLNNLSKELSELKVSKKEPGIIF
jgi:programmed cell death 6-interacting protein